MSTDKDDFDTIQPTEIPLTQPLATAGEPNRQFSRKLIIGAGLVLTLLLALAVIFVLPQMVSTPTNITTEESQEAAQASASQVARPKDSPWQDAQLEKARREALDIIAKLLERQQYLEAKAVNQWAPERYQEGTATAEQADIQYRQRDFEIALGNYQKALDIFTELEGLADKTLEQSLASGLEAIENGNASLARQHLELVLAIDPKNPAARNGLSRTEVLPQVTEEIAKARTALNKSQLETARKHFKAALKLDSDSRTAREGITRIDEQIINRDYIAAISKGFSALEAHNLNGAVSAFQQALKLKPNSADARRGLEQAQTRLTRLSLQAKLSEAAKREQQEAWRAAETLYSQILRNDSSVVDARVGQIRTSTRAELDEKLQDLIDNSMRLTSSNTFDNAQKLLDEARKVEPRGPRLLNQITTLQTLMIKASTPWPVEFQSDNATAVTIFRVGEQGSFDSKTLQLKPGRYVAFGTRKGFRDVRVEFHVTGAKTGPIVIECKEPI